MIVKFCSVENTELDCTSDVLPDLSRAIKYNFRFCAVGAFSVWVIIWFVVLTDSWELFSSSSSEGSESALCIFQKRVDSSLLLKEKSIDERVIFEIFVSEIIGASLSVAFHT